MRAILFPGQGSQYVGMASDFYQKYDSVKKIFNTVDETLGYSLSKIILNGNENELKLTQNTQPAIMTVGVSIFSILNNEFNYNLNNSKFFAGHSLGEYTALVCSGSLTLERAAYLLRERGMAMQASVPEDTGAMTAVIGMSLAEVEKEISLLPKNEVCEVANDNSNTQVVVSGTKLANEILNKNLKLKKKRGIALPVSAPFHCSLMQGALEKMKDKITSSVFTKPKPSIISNVTATDQNEPNMIKKLLVDQIVSKVRWRESVDFMIKNGVTEILEIGPGKVLSGLVKKIDNNVKIKNINSLEDLTDG